MYLELPSWSPDNEFLAVRAGNPKNTVPQILKNSDFFFFIKAPTSRSAPRESAHVALLPLSRLTQVSRQ